MKRERMWEEGEISRRDFLQGAGQLALGAAFAASGMGMMLPKEAQAFEGYPPGIEHCRDQMIKSIYYQVEHNDHRTASELLSGIWIQGLGIKNETPYIEPAYHFLLRKFNAELSRKNLWREYGVHTILWDWKKLQRDNPGLYYFSSGISAYFAHWIIKTYNREREAEENLLKSIFCSAYTSESIGLHKASEYQQASSMEAKEKMLGEVMANLKKMKADKNSTDPNDGYNRRLVAAWSSFVYVCHEGNKDDNDYLNPEGKMMNKLVEIPLRELVPRVRGPIHYGIGKR